MQDAEQYYKEKLRSEEDFGDDIPSEFLGMRIKHYQTHVQKIFS